jgi:glucosamine kinase
MPCVRTFHVAIYLGIDGGGTKTTCVVANENRVLGSATSGGSNITRWGEARVREALETGVKAACAAAKADPRRIGSTCVGLSGAGRPEVRDAVSRMMAEIVGGRIQVVSDLETTLEAAFGDGPGVITIAGTGSIAYGRDVQGRTARSGGWGLAISDEGSGQWIGRAAISAVLDAKHAGEDPPLLATILKEWRLSTLDELVRRANGSPAPDFASLFPLMLEAAENPRPSRAWVGHPIERPSEARTGDPAENSGRDPMERAAGSADVIAASVLDRAGTELAVLAKNVMRRLFGETGSVPVAMSGGVFRQSERVRQVFYNSVVAEFPQARVRADVVDAVDGALALARKG